MEQQTFTSLFKDLISRLYDRVAIETHPLTAFFPVPEDASTRRAEVVQKLILDEIEQLRPEGKDILVQSSEWRPYLILQKRYIEGQDPHEIARSLYIGDRQFRRDHSRALQALSLRVWQRYFLPEVIRGVISLIKRRLEIENVKLELLLCPSPVQVFTDRILLRQILLSLLNYVLHLRGQSGLTLRTEAGKAMSIRILFDADEQWGSIQNDERDSLEFARRLSKKLPARVDETYPRQEQSGPAEIRLVFGVSQRQSILIVDDQVGAQKMFQRYLSLTNLEVIGVTDPTQGLLMAQKIQPALLILDVMMPHVDGWEVLQTLQLDPETKHIPVIVCSAWGEPELARSLGAVAFLKKPVIQKDLIEVLVRLGLVWE
jgi:CheY-like chemotaxis protein